MEDRRGDSADGAHDGMGEDAAFEQLIELFMNELPERVRAIESAAAEANTELVQRLAHQLKGSAGGYGFWNIGDAASRVETALRRAAWEANPIECAQTEVRELIQLCRSVAEDAPSEPSPEQAREGRPG
ncbi:MAG: hypothetical protein DHS20C14_19840 [Phycisphaeraceae bacterium]|nr:MAG: hypothetical protein DHS20C14_19840 [Phycisphaeraceae bacterium]